KRQRSQDEAKAEAPASKRPRYKPAPPPPPQTRTMSDIARRHLVVALVDRSDPNGRMKPEQWRAVESKLLVELVKRMEEPKSQPVAFGNAGWLEGVKLLSCRDDTTLKWVTSAVASLGKLWEGAELEVVDRTLIPSIPKAKVFFPGTMPKEKALKLLQWQNTEVPTAG
ncbi:hypothetical protein KR018_011902, partial [Drosophila ironensis]